VQDLLFYRDELNNDIRKFFSPWAFEQTETPLLQKRIYVATLLDFIDELPYVHHIRLLKVFRNDTEVFDEITSSTEIHLLTTANDHNITVLQYGTA
jgi:5'(3')-deoxyribonucleotidase